MVGKERLIRISLERNGSQTSCQVITRIVVQECQTHLLSSALSTLCIRIWPQLTDTPPPLLIDALYG